MNEIELKERVKELEKISEKLTERIKNLEIDLSMMMVKMNYNFSEFAFCKDGERPFVAGVKETGELIELLVIEGKVVATFDFPASADILSFGCFDNMSELLDRDVFVASEKLLRH